MKNMRAVAYWDFYDSTTGEVLEKERLIKRGAMPTIGGLVIGIPGKPNAIIRNFSFRGSKNNLLCYYVYV